MTDAIWAVLQATDIEIPATLYQPARRELEELERRIYCPGTWRCAKCNFTLIQSNLNVLDGTVTARDDPGEKCPNCAGPLWRVSEREERIAAMKLCNEQFDKLAAARARIVVLEGLINNPVIDDWFNGVRVESAHQIERWGSMNDEGKSPLDWFWLIGYLAQKAAMASITGDADKAKHHTISTGAAMLNWFHAINRSENRMRPGIAEPAGEANDAI
jgi:hypothetical protein